MRLKFANIIAYIFSKLPFILLVIPLMYVGMLFLYAVIFYGGYYDDWTQIPFDFYSLLVGGILSFFSLVTLHIITTYKMTAARNEQVLTQSHKNLMAELLVTQNLTNIFNSDLFRDLQNGNEIRKVKKLTGGYSGAQVYSFYRGTNRVPDILKVAEVEEIENEYQKFTNYVAGQLLIGPNICRKYIWGNYAGLEYNLNWRQLGSDHLTFLELYRQCLYGNTQPKLRVETIEEIIKQRLFIELRKSWSWWNVGRVNVNIYKEYYPFTRKFRNIHPRVRTYSEWGQSNLDLKATIWNRYLQALHTLLSVRDWWDDRMSNDSYHYLIPKAVIHGDLNSRNILIEAGRDHNNIHTIGLVDFSHTGNGLTIKRTKEFIRQDIQLDEERGHIANDFCRLEADIKFYLTDLNDEPDLGQAWLLECLLLKYDLKLPDWAALPPNAFAEVLEEQGLLTEPKWSEFADPGHWQGGDAKKFILAWQSIKAIRDSLRVTLPDQPLAMEPFYLALLQAGLPLIYYEDERFHNPDLQKFYLVLASALLCTKL